MSGTRAFFLFSAIWLTGCDLDRDGFLDAEDCEDYDPNSYPGAPEICDAVDNDCDGEIDEDALEGWYLDLDNDDFGDPDTRPTCDSIASRTTTSGDCDDADSAIHPEAAEVCDGIDNDCDGHIDSMPPALGETAQLGSDLYIVTGQLKGDSAGHSVAGVGDVNGDGLDDVLVGVPGDNNENATPGEAWLVSDGEITATLIGEDPGDGAGFIVAPAGDQDGDGLADVLVASTQHVDEDLDGSLVEGAVYVVTGPISGDIDLADSAGRIVGSGVGEGFAWAIAGGGDVDGDGVDDILVGAWARDGGEWMMAGAVGIFYGPVLETRHWSEADAWLLGSMAADAAGWSVAFAGDTDGDGTDDVLVGAIGHDEGGAEAGAAFLVRGPIAGEIYLDDADAILIGETDFASTGTSVAGAGDVDGDGLDDLLIGAPGIDRAYVVLSPVSGEMSLALADVTIDGNGISSETGFSLAGLGDMDGDGLGEVLVGAPHGESGGAYLFMGPTSGDLTLNSATLALVGGRGDLAGFSVASAGDTDGDGVNDLVVGAMRDDLGGRGTGAAYLIPGADSVSRYMGETYFADADGDGYGDPDVSVQACGVDSGALSDSSDCDDSNASISPAAEEICDEQDNDCDGLIDEVLEGCDVPEDEDPDPTDEDPDPTNEDPDPTDDEPDPTDEESDPVEDDPADDDPADDETEEEGESEDDPVVDLPEDEDEPEDEPEGEDETEDEPEDEDETEDEPEDEDETADETEDEPEDEDETEDEPEDEPEDEDETADETEDGSEESPADTGGIAEEDPQDEEEAEETPDEETPDDDEEAPEEEPCETSTWYTDADADGYGDASAPVEDCLQPSGTVEDATDCDDSNAEIWPGATEVCDELDNSCDGRVDLIPADLDPVEGLELADLLIEGERWGQEGGYALSTVGDLDGDGLADLAVGAPGEDGEAGAVFVFYAPLLGGVELDDADAILRGDEPGGWAGYTLSGLGDINGDGHDDIAIGAPNRRTFTRNGWQEGAVFVVYGPISGEVDLGAADAVLVGERRGDFAGVSVASAGDVNADGIEDLVIGASEADPNGPASGAAYIVYGPISGNLMLNNADATIYGEHALTLLGHAVAGVGDTNGDGYDDVLIGAWGDDTAMADAGAALLFHGPLSGELTVEDADAVFTGATEGALAGYSLASAGDVNEDGLPDLLIGAPGTQNSIFENIGAAHLVLAPFEGQQDLAMADATYIGTNTETVGYSLAGGEDFDGDGSLDLALGTPWRENRTYHGRAGAVHLFYGTPLGVMSTNEADLTIEGDQSDDKLGWALAWTGDIDGDGGVDLAMGAPGLGEGGGVAVLTGAIHDDLSLTTTWFIDSDGDGYGEASGSVNSCDAPSGMVSSDGDCDDDDDSLFPGADEYCDGVDEDCDGDIDEGEAVDAPTWWLDGDDDGFGGGLIARIRCEAPENGHETAEDCDDRDSNVYPGAEEVCDLTDNDCDDLIDEDYGDSVEVFYADMDGDGYGDPDLAAEACMAPAGTVSNGDDCNDGDASISPAASEICDTVDNDCDGAADEEDAEDAIEFYVDADGDGWGDSDNSVVSCSPPSGAVFQGEDCDDTDPTISPDTDELCHDGVDNNCDGSIDESTAADVGIWYRDADEDGYGNPDRWTASCDMPSGYTTDSSDCDDQEVESYPGADEFCDGDDNDCDGTTDEGAPDTTDFYVDDDRDGFGTGAGVPFCDKPSGYATNNDDCDDSLAMIYPDATEACDDLDGDCDGTVDEDAGDTYYLDNDGDEYGDPSISLDACDAPDGYVVNHTDCNDTDASIHPNADETCGDGIDSDCDDTDDDDDAVDAAAWYTDSDGDGYGGKSAGAIYSCEQPTGTVSNGEDCRDKNADINPDAVEVCDDEDNDCDGDVDEDGAADASTFYSDTDGDGWGDEDAIVEACTLPEDASETPGDCDDGNRDVNPEERDYCGDDVDSDCDGQESACELDSSTWLAAADAVLTGEGSGYEAGTSVAGAGDLDGDGYGDFIVGSPYYKRDTSEGTYKSGTSYVIYGPVSGSQALGDAGYRRYGVERYDKIGHSVSGVGDIDGDGLDEAIVGAPYDSSADNKAGAVYLLNDAPTSHDLITSGSTAWTGENNNDRAGNAVAGVGDVDGDGTADILVGVERLNLGAKKAGGAYLLTNASVGGGSLSGAKAILYGEEKYDYAGHSVAPAGDVDGDGFADVLIGAPGTSDGGAVYLVLGPVSGSVALAGADAKWTAEDIGDEAGTAVAALGDLDGDGVDEFAVGAPGATGTKNNDGVVYVLNDLAGGSLGEVSWRYNGPSSSQGAGFSVLGPGDLDGDGNRDLVVGSVDAENGAGRVYVVMSPTDGAFDLDDADGWHEGATGDAAGTSLGASDIDGDGLPDLLIGGLGDDTADTDAGAVWILSEGGL